MKEEEVRKALEKVMHPEINCNLVELGMIKITEVKDDAISVTLMLPFLNVPIKEDLISLIKESITNLDKEIKVDIKTAEMDEKERKKFMKLARENWKG
jgi:metal-sulfur cluster biosynthetic enzyme